MRAQLFGTCLIDNVSRIGEATIKLLRHFGVKWDIRQDRPVAANLRTAGIVVNQGKPRNIVFPFSRGVTILL
jgi:hypothetical protein